MKAILLIKNIKNKNMKNQKLSLEVTPIIQTTDYGCIVNNNHFLTKEAASEFLQISLGKLDILTGEGKIEKVKYNNNVYYNYKELERYVNMFFINGK